GQVKAGKTSLVNAMVGRPGLLPADINPWTSVITSLHVSPRIRENAQSAKFRFFSEDEWSNLLQRGGRVGELARRAGADKELETVRAQLEEMREKSKQRLGRSFELLLGQEHDYGYVDPELVERFIEKIDPRELTDGRNRHELSKHTALSIGVQIERIADAIDDRDPVQLRSLAIKLGSIARSKEILPIAETAESIERRATESLENAPEGESVALTPLNLDENEEWMALLQDTNELLDLCRATQNVFLGDTTERNRAVIENFLAESAADS
ncbi:MAG: hypothetical protein AAF989_06855, partial [Planctomycetota bacterium]